MLACNLLINKLHSIAKFKIIKPIIQLVAFVGKATWQVLAQFFVCLTLTFLAFIAFDSLKAYGGHVISYMLSFATLLENPFAALAYLSMPYIIMLAI
jgi:hypothetical protein